MPDPNDTVVWSSGAEELTRKKGAFPETSDFSDYCPGCAAGTVPGGVRV